mmetsp:Transcript_35930/g.110694  ORF Transcript_35930/g.110694 Transcript_35930/m.110694 type:complete len:218 (+) Transcript_35930:68-721(+)
MPRTSAQLFNRTRKSFQPFERSGWACAQLPWPTPPSRRRQSPPLKQLLRRRSRRTPLRGTASSCRNAANSTRGWNAFVKRLRTARPSKSPTFASPRWVPFSRHATIGLRKASPPRCNRSSTRWRSGVPRCSKMVPMSTASTRCATRRRSARSSTRSTRARGTVSRHGANLVNPCWQSSTMTAQNSCSGAASRFRCSRILQNPTTCKSSARRSTTTPR